MHNIDKVITVLGSIMLLGVIFVSFELIRAFL